MNSDWCGAKLLLLLFSKPTYALVDLELLIAGNFEFDFDINEFWLILNMLELRIAFWYIVSCFQASSMEWCRCFEALLPSVIFEERSCIYGGSMDL